MNKRTLKVKLSDIAKGQGIVKLNEMEIGYGGVDSVEYKWVRGEIPTAIIRMGDIEINLTGTDLEGEICQQ